MNSYFYVMLGAVMGSTVNRPEESSQATVPQVMLAMVSFLIAMSGMMDPTGLAVRIFAYLPFSSTMVMPMYYNGTEIPRDHAMDCGWHSAANEYSFDICHHPRLQEFRPVLQER